MGSNNSTRRVSFEADENDNVTVVKGIRAGEELPAITCLPAFRLEEERTKAQAQVQQEVQRMLEAERVAAQESIRQALLKERVTAEDDRLRAQFYAQQLEEREQELRKQDAFYKEQLAKLEERVDVYTLIDH
ncbi:hypothetical protein Z043_113828 [Scleropages formosus]|uniref:Coiled-coil-helix-coiled-coil-helix domain-containing protein 3, mitochondrial-like n=1 Tax=Scleropages formosus TaxID=113540 RepID=A0A0P7V051_SCLFO|nr:hypothetical protein Z043_113828 [Scleropages formosus]